jgi:hypothetical protein
MRILKASLTTEIWGWTAGRTASSICEGRVLGKEEVGPILWRFSSQSSDLERFFEEVFR